MLMNWLTLIYRYRFIPLYCLLYPFHRGTVHGLQVDVCSIFRGTHHLLMSISQEKAIYLDNSKDDYCSIYQQYIVREGRKLNNQSDFPFLKLSLEQKHR